LNDADLADQAVLPHRECVISEAGVVLGEDVLDVVGRLLGPATSSSARFGANSTTRSGRK
jgi:hypothetical protein